MSDSFEQIEQWNAASLRLEDFLRAHSILSRPHFLYLTTEIIYQARQIRGERPDSTPMEITMDLAMERTTKWFADLLPDGSGTPNADQGRVAYFAAGIDRKWPEAFLMAELPSEVLEAARAASVQAGPELEFRSLIRKEVNYGPMEDLARETWEQFSWGHVLRTFLLWVGIFFISYWAWFQFFE